MNTASSDSEPKIAGGGQAAASPHGRPADHGNGRLRHHVQKQRNVGVVPGQIPVQRSEWHGEFHPVGIFLAAVCVTTGTEAAVLSFRRRPSEYHDLGCRVARHGLDSSIQFGGQLTIYGISSFRPIERDQANALGDFRDNYG